MPRTTRRYAFAPGGDKGQQGQVVDLLWPTRPRSTPRTTTALRLCTAAARGHEDVVELLLANGAEVNAKDSYG